ncbi:hypothetical protein [Paucibacter soli]|uniref:hypothetical protein n=1 Tax=Paucibacter soli TaxID=3133433 RepID=UPI0030ACEC49
MIHAGLVTKLTVESDANKSAGSAPSNQATPDDQVQVSQDGSTVWVFAMDGSTVGRFSKRFGLDVHTTVTAQMNGSKECIHCTHEPAGHKEWLEFCELMKKHYDIEVSVELVEFQ